MLRRSTILLFALFTYCWSASCLGELLLVQQLSGSHAESAVQIAQNGGRELVFHHAGHQDPHEPAVADSYHYAEPLLSDAGHHGDHVVALGCEQLSSPALTKDFKLGDSLLTPPVLQFVIVLASPIRAPRAVYPRPTLRNSLPELIRSQRLLV